MSNNEALEILRKESACLKEDKEFCLIVCDDRCKHYVGRNEYVKALEVAIEALELCVMVEDDFR